MVLGRDNSEGPPYTVVATSAVFEVVPYGQICPMNALLWFVQILAFPFLETSVAMNRRLYVALPSSKIHVKLCLLYLL
jgi:hypothetical protein